MSHCDCDDCNMLAVKHARVLSHEPNGSRTERSTRDALAELGARVVVVLNMEELPADFDAPDKIGAIQNEAERLGLIRREARQ